MPKDPIIAIRDCLTEIAILQEIAGRMTMLDRHGGTPAEPANRSAATPALRCSTCPASRR